MWNVDGVKYMNHKLIPNTRLLQLLAFDTLLVDRDFLLSCVFIVEPVE